MFSEDYDNAIEHPSISVIVPVYKVEKYLSKCIDSLISQTYKNYELILVDDGSPDSCGDICDEYKSKYSNIIVIHQENQGLSMARNNAVPYARGDYITFIDSDDYVTPDYLEYLISLIKTYKTQISVGGMIYQYENKPLMNPREETKKECYTVDEALTKMNYGIGFGATAWGKLYKKELIEKYPYPQGKLYEDLFTTYKIISAADGVALGNKQIYYWVQRTGSIMRRPFRKDQFDGILAAKEQLQYIEKYHPAALPAAKYRYAAKAIELIGISLLSGGNRKVFKLLKREMKKY